MADQFENVRELLLVRIGEITLKGLNRGRFVARLISNMKRRINDLGEFSIVQSHSRIWIHALSGNPPMQEVARRLSSVFGIVSISPAIEFESDWGILVRVVEEYAADVLAGAGRRTFKFETTASQCCLIASSNLFENTSNVCVKFIKKTSQPGRAPSTCLTPWK